MLSPTPRFCRFLGSRGLLWALADSMVWWIALYAGLLLRLDFDASRLGGFRVLLLVPVACAAQFSFGFCLGLYRGRWIVGSFDEVAALSQAAALATAVLLGVDLLFTDRPAPLSSVVGAGIVALVATGAIRYTQRTFIDRRLRAGAANRTRVVVFGAGEGGQRAVRAMLSEQDSPFVPVALLDDDPAKGNLTIRGVRVIGDRSAISRAADEFAATVLVIAIPAADGPLVRALSGFARDAGMEVRIVPSVRELFDGNVTVRDLRVPTEADLLGRHTVEIDLGAVAAYLHDKRVVVTGAGGSIGSELCRQISRLGPSRLVMTDRDDSGLHAVQLSLDGRALLDSADLVLLDIRDRAGVADLFERVRPEVVFHAAALKHLTLLEAYPAEALKTNVWGTLAVLDAAASVGVERFVNISTDKAAEPCSALGYSKRITEASTAHNGCHEPGVYLSVRFGNVLGSRGSVLTAFRTQLQEGGPLTVTDPEVTRYFMTVEEAVQLVVQAGAIGQDGQVLVLDMGDPVRIADVARQLAATRTPEVGIVFTGLRPGEKLHEALYGEDEVPRSGVHPLITHLEVPALSPEGVRAVDPTLGRDEMLAVLEQLAMQVDDQLTGFDVDREVEEWLRDPRTAR